MKYTIIFAMGILSASLFTGCNIEETSNNNVAHLQKIQTSSMLKESEPTQQKIIGTWKGACHHEEYNDESYQAELTFNPNLSFTYIEKIYPTQDCVGDYYTEQNKDIGSYSLGQVTIGADGEQAYNFETHSIKDSGMNDEYFMVRFTGSTLVFTDENRDNSQPNGETPQTRNNYFKEVPRIKFTKNFNL